MDVLTVNEMAYRRAWLMLDHLGWHWEHWTGMDRLMATPMADEFEMVHWTVLEMSTADELGLY